MLKNKREVSDAFQRGALFQHKSTRSTAIYGLFFLSILFTSVFILIVYLTAERKKEDKKWVLHTYNVLQKVTSLESTLKDIETGQRGYLLTGKADYLRPYHDGLLRIEKELGELQTLIADNPSQLANITRLKKFIHLKITELAHTIDYYDQGKKDKSLALVNTDEGKISMDSIRQIIHEILSQEDDLLAIRKAKWESTISLHSNTTLVGLCYVWATLILAVIMIRRRDNQNARLILQLQAQNADLESEVAKRTAELQAANERLRKIDTEKNKFLGSAAHDLKSPLNRIKGLVTLINASQLGSLAKEAVTRIKDEISQMIRLIGDLLDVNRIEQGVEKPVFENVNLSELLGNVVSGFQDMAGKKNIGLKFDDFPEQLYWEIDKVYLGRIMENLVSNALKFTEPGKKVRVGLTLAQGSVLIAIEDEGQGIADDEIPLLFSKFTKLSARPTAGESSTGLGLSIVKELVELLEGTITCSSNVGQGTTFQLEFASNS